MIPHRQQIYAPLLKRSAERNEVIFSNVVKLLESDFNLTDQERDEMLPRGKDRVFRNRAGWAKTNLIRAGLLESGTKKGEFRITEEGKRALNSGEVINDEYLKKFPAFRKYLARKGTRKRTEDSTESEFSDSEATDDDTPDERLLKAHAEINTALSANLLDLVISKSFSFFEDLIVRLLPAMGYGDGSEDAGRTLGMSGDGGVDGVIDQDPLGVDQIYVQAKRYASDHSVGPDAINSFFGALNRRNSSKGIFFTTSSFTSGAIKAAKELGGIRLVDGEELALLMIRYGVGCKVEDTLHLKKVDEDFFDE